MSGSLLKVQESFEYPLTGNIEYLLGVTPKTNGLFINHATQIGPQIS